MKTTLEIPDDSVGKLKHLRNETARIMQLIEAEFETIDPEDWK